MKEHTVKYRIRKLVNSGYFPLGESRCVLDVEVNENRALQIFHPSIVEVPRAALQEKLGVREQELLLTIFGGPDVPRLESEHAMLLTEPLFADGLLISEEEQVSFYRRLAAILGEQGYTVVLKPHPRDRVDYAPLGISVIERNFPIELLQYLSVSELGCAATRASSAIFTIAAEKRLVWQEDKFIEIQ